MQIIRPVLITISAIFILGIVLFLHQTSQQFFGIAYLFGLMALFVKSIVDATKKSYHLSIMFLIALALFTTQFETLRNTLIPIVKSPNIEISYDLSTSDFTDDQRIDIKASTGNNIVLEKVPGKINYKIYLPHQIEDVDTFYTSYDNNGQHIARQDWTKNIDYKFSENCITSEHQLNDVFNNGKGRHLIVYRYRSPLFKQLFSQAQAFGQNLGNNLKSFLVSYGPLALILFISSLLVLYCSRLWKFLSAYADRIILCILFIVSLRLKMQILAIFMSVLLIIGIRRIRMFLLKLMEKIERSKKGGFGWFLWEEPQETDLPKKIDSPIDIANGQTPKEFIRYYEHGRAALQFGDKEQAKIMFEKAFEMDHNNIEINISLGLVYNMLGQNEKAVECNKRALALSPNNFTAQFNLAVATNHLHGSTSSLPEYLEAEKIAQETGLIENITIGKLNLFLGHDYRETGNLEEAHRRYREAERIFKLYDTPDSKFWLKDTYGNFKRLDKLEDEGFSSSSAIK